MPEWKRIPIPILAEDLDRYVYKAERDSKPGEKPVNPLHLMAMTLHDDAQHLPARQQPATKRPQSAVREEGRARSASGTSAHTEALRIVAPGEPA